MKFALVLALTLVSVADEIAIGKQAQAKVKQETPQASDEAVQACVARIGHRLAAHVTGERYPYSFSVAAYREINAFALPGGPVWVNRGAMQSAGTESQVAGVLPHESRTSRSGMRRSSGRTRWAFP
jgi:predicted Zn-dependent protease